MLRLFRVEPKSEANSTFTLEEVATIVSQSRREGVLQDPTGTVAAALEFTDKDAGDIAVPLEQLVTLPETASTAEIERAVASHGYSRYVIVDDSGAPTGYVHLKDILRITDARADDPIPAKRIHHMVPVGVTTDLEDALALMRERGRHLANVRESDGRTVGVLFLEDILEELVGEVNDATERQRRR